MKPADISLSLEDLWRANFSFLLKKHFVRVPMLFLTFSLAAFVWTLLLFKSPMISLGCFFVGMVVFYAIMRLTTISRLKRTVTPESLAFSLSVVEAGLRVKWNMTEKIYRREDLNDSSSFMGVWTLFSKSGETITVPTKQLTEEQKKTLQSFVG